jgi:hypothetical protein
MPTKKKSVKKNKKPHWSRTPPKLRSGDQVWVYYSQWFEYGTHNPTLLGHIPRPHENSIHFWLFWSETIKQPPRISLPKDRSKAWSYWNNKF